MKKKRMLAWLLALIFALMAPLPGVPNVAHADMIPSPLVPPHITVIIETGFPRHLLMWSDDRAPEGWHFQWRLSSNPDMASWITDESTPAWENMSSIEFTDELLDFMGNIAYLAVRYVLDGPSEVTSEWSDIYSVEINDSGEITNVELYEDSQSQCPKSPTGFHEWNWLEEETNDYDCTKPYNVRQVCKYCGTKGASKTNPAEYLDHHWSDEFVVVIEPTTDREGKGYYSCVHPGCTVRKIEEIPKLGSVVHEWEVYTIKDPTCTEPGVQGKRCKICGTEWTGYRKEIPALGHYYVYTTPRFPTCTQTGIHVTSCLRAGCTFEKITVLPLLDHSWETKVKRQPTCTEAGISTEVCSVCGQEKPNSEQPIATLEHSWERKVKQQPTCTEAGISAEVCSVCGHEKEGSEERIDPLEHQWERKVKLEPKCLEYGKSIMTCTVCGAEDPNTEERIDPPGHSWEDRVIEEPTCAKKGWTQKFCTVCGAEGDLDLIDKLEHDWVQDEDKDPTCTEWGRLSGHCSVCGHTESLDLEPHGHDWIDVKTIREPDCKNAGVKLVRCRICNEEEEQAIPIVDTHDLVEEVLVQPTCTEWGKYRVYCKICGFETVKGDKPPNGHTEVPVEDRAFNCMQGGMVGATKCSVCGEILNKGIYRPAIGHHTWAQKVIEPSTCQKAGSYRRTCTVCSAEEIVALPLAEHTWIRGRIFQEPNCLHEGFATTVCLACGTYGEPEIFPKTYEHHWVTHPGKEPTCTQPGYTESISCDVCAEIQKRVEPIPPAPHKEVTIHAMRPTATLEGRTEGIRCGRCGVWIVPCKTLPKLGSEGTEHNMTKASPPLTKGSNESASFTSDADFQDFSHVTLNDSIVDPANYDAREGSTIITFKPAFLETLSVGKHKVKIVSASGSAHGVLEIKAKTDQTSDATPKTGENSGHYQWLALMLLSAGGLIFLARNKKRILMQRD